MQEFERRSRNKATAQELHDGDHSDYHDRETHKGYAISAEPEPDHTLVQKAFMYGYARAARIYSEHVDARHKARVPIMQLTHCEIPDDYSDLEVTMEGLESYYQSARPVTVIAWKNEMVKRKNKFTEADVRRLDDGKGRIKDPFSMDVARGRPDYCEFEKASKLEWEAIESRNTFSAYMTLAAIRLMGIMQSIVPCRELTTIKSIDGNVEKWKNRLVIQGSPNNCKHGEHYHDTFSPAPNCTTTRMLLCFIVQLGLVLCSVDVSSAYLHGRLPLDERMPIRMPKHLRKYDKNGEEMYRILLGSCYGCPQSSKVWSDLRDKWLIDTFNKQGWTCTKSRRDPCLFIFTHSRDHKARHARAGRFMGYTSSHTARATMQSETDMLKTHGFDNPNVNYTFLVVHTDDVDIVGQNKNDVDHIINLLHDRFKVTKSDPQVMLGLKRIIAPDGLSVEVTQTAYIDGMASDFKADVAGKRTPSTPFPPGLYLSKQEPDKINVKESQMILKEKHYLKITGTILWAARMTFCECAVGCHYLTRMMAAPTMEAYNAAVHMMCYMIANRTKGIKFRRVDNPTLVTYYDASNRGDVQDNMKAIGGHIVFMCNGPLIWSSKKLKHVGMSSAHNEYQALCEATKCTIWLRYMLKEMGLTKWVHEPTLMLGDNDAATTLCRNDIVTPGNCWYRTSLMFNKERFEGFDIDPARVDTKLNYADGQTKSVPRQVIDAHVPAIKGYVLQQDLPPRPRR